MQGYLFYTPRDRPSNPVGGVYPAGTWTIYLTQTTTLSPVYSDLNLTTPITNPVVADSGGLFPAFYMDPSIIYRVILKDQFGVVIYDVDPYVVINSPFSTALTADSNGHLTVPLPTSAGSSMKVSGSSANIAFEASALHGQNATLRLGQIGAANWDLVNSATTGLLAFYNGTGNVLTLNINGTLSAANKFYPAQDTAALQTSCALYAGVGAPNNANGANGDIYFRSDGGALTTVYQRRAGTWAGIV